MTVLVTGGDGFVGRHLVAALRAEGATVCATWLPAEGRAGPLVDPGGVTWYPLQLTDPASVAALPLDGVEAVVHLAALASGAASFARPDLAWAVNAEATARLAERVAARGGVRFLLASSAEVYGAAAGPLDETAPIRPVSPYAASKAAAELAARTVARCAGLPLIVARPFPHTGPGQPTQFVVPALAARLVAARSVGATHIPVGNLDVVRDLLDVRDVAQAYVRLLARGRPGATYNIASGTGHALREVFDRLARLLDVEVTPVVDPSLVRAVDIPSLIGDPSRLVAETGWRPAVPLDQTLQDVVNAQAH